MGVSVGKAKLLIENFLVYGFGGIVSKIIPLLMVPIVVRIMPDSTYFGVSDLSNTLISLTTAVAILGMYDGMFRLFFEKDDDEYKVSVCSTALFFTMGTSILIFGLMIVFREMIAKFFFNGNTYVSIVWISAVATLVGTTNGIVSAPTRMQNKRKIFLVTNTVTPIISYSVSIPLLLNGYYTIALPIAGVVSGLVMEISFGIMNRKWFKWRYFDYNILKSLLVIAIPLFPNFLIYWIFNSSDRVMISHMLGVDQAGIYSVGAKLGHVSQLIYVAFAGGWQYFAFSTMREENQVKSNSLIFEYLGIISYVATILVCLFSEVVFKFLFPLEYLNGYIVSPYLFFVPLLQMLFQVAANQFLVIKKTWPNIFILGIGALLNLVFNFKLIPLWGIEGAALGSMLGYLVSVILCIIVLVKMKLMMISNRFIVASLLFIFFFVFWRFNFVSSPV